MIAESTLDFSSARLPPFRHQVEDTARLVRSPYLFITSEMRTGKSKIVIDATQFMFQMGMINQVVVVSPNPVRSVWFDQSLGELHKHLWESTPATVQEYHARTRVWQWPAGAKAPGKRLYWVVTNFEFIRSPHRLKDLLNFCTKKTLLVIDESSFVKNWKAAQTEACVLLRWACGMVVLLNGTPITHSPLDLFSQGNLLHPKILDCKHVTLFKSRYAEQKPVIGPGGKAVLTPSGHPVQQIVGWRNLEDLRRRFEPYVIRRLQKDCLDLPPKLEPVAMSAEFSPAEWRIYKSVRDDLVVWLSTSSVVTAAQAAVKVMRLAQITSGFIGGVEDAFAGETDEEVPVWMQTERLPEPPPHAGPMQYVGRAKLNVLIWFLKKQLEEIDNPHIVVWFRFRAELARAMEEIAKELPQFTLGSIHGGQSSKAGREERLRAMQLLHPDTAPRSPVVVCGTSGTGSYGLNFTAANISINCSFDYSLGKFLQQGDRVYGPGQVSPVAYFDILAVGPSGQRTIDHAIVESRRNSENIANWTTETWINAITRE